VALKESVPLVECGRLEEKWCSREGCLWLIRVRAEQAAEASDFWMVLQSLDASCEGMKRLRLQIAFSICICGIS